VPYIPTVSDLYQLPAKYFADLVKHAPLFSGLTVYGEASIYECHVEGEDAPLVIVLDGVAYETAEYEVSDLKH
jgi:hypothetical protein